MIRFPFLLNSDAETTENENSVSRWIEPLRKSRFFSVMMQMSHVTLKKTRKNIKGINDFGLSEGFSPWQTRLREERGKA